MKAGIIAAAFLANLAAGASAQQAKPFGPTPVPCNTAGWKDCKVSFDGSTVTRTYVHPRGGATTETHSGCTASGRRIACPPGSWRTSGGYTGASESLSVTLNPAGAPTGTGH